MKPDIVICRANEVVSLVNKAEQDGAPFDIVISIEHPVSNEKWANDGQAPRLAKEISAAWQDRQLILVCWDIEQPVENREEMEVPGADIVQGAFDHADRWQPEGRPLRMLIHCRAGKARSTAVALGLLNRASEPGAEPENLEELLIIRPIAAPNIAIVRHADDILGRNGALVKAVEDHPEVAKRRAETHWTRLHQIESGAGLRKLNAG